MMDVLGRYLLAVVAGALALYVFAWPSEPTIFRYPEVVVRELPPDTVVDWRDRIVTKEVPVSGPVIRAPGQGVIVQTAFCAPIVTPGAVIRDTIQVMTSIDYDPGWFWRPSEIQLRILENTGDVLEHNYQVHGAWSARRFGSTITVRSSRLPIQEVVEFLTYAALGALVNRAIGVP